MSLFYKQRFFKNDGWILENIYKIQHIPNVIIQGRYDVVCPMRSAWDLHKAWNNSNLVIIKDAGHSMLGEKCSI